MSRLLLAPLATAAAMLGVAASVSAQNYPYKPIRIVNGAPAGTTTDIVARVIAEGLSSALGQQVIVDTRGDRIAQEIVAKSLPDGYTLCVTGTGFWVEPLLRKLSYDPVKDFVPISLATMSPNILVVSPSLGVKSVKELIALAKAQPGKLNFASSGTGGASHLSGELFKAMAGINMVHVAYTGAGVALTGLMGGETQLMFATAGSVVQLMKGGKVVPLAVTSAQPTALVPGLPTIAASGVPGYEAVSMVSAFAPTKTPPALIDRLHREIVRLLNGTDVKARLFSVGVEVVGSTPEQLRIKMQSEMATMGKLIKELGIRAD